MKRLSWLDSLKGFAMICVVIGHMPIDPKLKTIIYAFHMPLFFLLSGYSYGLSKKRVGWGEFVKKKAKQLLLPYVLLSILVLPFWIVNHKILYNVNNTLIKVIVGTIYANQAVISMLSNAMWFLPCLFLLSILFYSIEAMTNKNQKHMSIFVGGSMMVSIILNYQGIRLHLPWHLQTLFTGLVFFFIGYCFVKNVRLQKKVETLNPFVVVFALFVCLILVLDNGKVSMHINNYNKMLLYYFNATAISLLLISLFQNFKNDKVLGYVGQNTLVILAFHNSIIWFFKRISPISMYLVEEYAIIMSFVVVICCIPFIYTINKYIPQAAAKQ